MTSRERAENFMEYLYNQSGFASSQNEHFVQELTAAIDEAVAEERAKWVQAVMPLQGVSFCASCQQENQAGINKFLTAISDISSAWKDKP